MSLQRVQWMERVLLALFAFAVIGIVATIMIVSDARQQSIINHDSGIANRAAICINMRHNDSAAYNKFPPCHEPDVEKLVVLAN